MFLHVMLNEKFTEPFIEFVCTHFEHQEHLFIIIGKGIGAAIKKRPNVIIMPHLRRGVPILLLHMMRARKILLHSLFNPRVVQLLAMQPWLLKKCNWYVWGGDLYSYLAPKLSRSAKLYEWVRAFVISRLGEITTIVPGDYRLVQEWYHTKAKYYHGLYINPMHKSDLDLMLTQPSPKKAGIYIQIGNSADPSNRHIEILNDLSRFKNCDIRIFAPLSYGDMKYAADVIAHGERLFGDKFLALQQMLTPSEYSVFLRSIDIAIFNHERQQALGNIRALIYLKKKVFLRDDISSWEYLNNDLGIDVYAYDSIRTANFDEFIHFEQQENNHRIIAPLFDKAYIRTIWEPIFTL